MMPNYLELEVKSTPLQKFQPQLEVDLFGKCGTYYLEENFGLKL
jgi:hypothetical protein